MQRCAGIRRGEWVRERDSPGQVGWPPEATASQEASQPADHLADRNTGRESIARGPDRHGVAAHVPEGHAYGQ